MIEYKFYKNEIGTPQFSIKGELEGLNELGSCNNDYLEEIVLSLNKLLKGNLERYDFGYEVYSIECRKEISKVIDTHNNWACIAEISTQEIYKLMQDWLFFLKSNEPMKASLLNLVKNLKQRKNMFLYASSYASYVNFLNGYDLCMEEMTNESHLKEFQKWLQEKAGHHFSMHWSSYILQELANDDDEIATQKLIELLDEFLDA
jgi:hypothetical protein